ncbi:Formin-like protein [Thalictrum thalictroides]|uniref:Formin-like protein n=1 Tax=Thalictrum thalictroides TaxID=46969 RepID=A0A7J6UZB8_THATH|nr:Formin-like protein [Thalictrum thalictroides]
MVSRYQILHLILYIFLTIFFLNAKLLLADSLINSAEGPTLQDQYWMVNNAEGNEKEIKEVSGDDESDKKQYLTLEKFRLLLGIRSFNIRTRGRHTAHVFLSPSPTPNSEVEAPAPVPVPLVPKHVHFHSQPPRTKLRAIPLHHEAQHEHPNKTRQKRTVIAIAVSAGIISLITFFGLMFFCWKYGRSRRRRSLVKISVSCSDGESRRSKYVNSSHSISKVSFDLGPEHFYLNTLEPVSESGDSNLKHTSKDVNVSVKQNQIFSSLEEKSESGREPIVSQPHKVNCSLTEEIHSVHEVEEPNISETDSGNSSLPNEISPVEEPLLSDDESFHSVCDSCSSTARTSDASDGDLSNQKEVCSPLSYPSMSSPSHSVTPRRRSPWKVTPSPPTTLDLRSKQTMNSMSSPIYPKLIPSPPPLPPPPPPPVNFMPAKSSFQQKHIPTTSNVSSPQNSGSSGSNSNQQTQFPQQQLKHASTSTFHGTPPPPCPPMPPPTPPPSFRGPNSSSQPPPPPPGFPQFTPVGRDGAPLTKLKPLHWDKVRATPDRSMIWDKLKSSSFEFDEKMIESLFGYNKQIKNDEAKSKSPSPAKHVLEPKRLQNMTILLKALNATSEQVCNALTQGEGLCLQQLEALVKMVPTKEEETKLLNYQGDINALGSTEMFVRAVLNVPFAFTRIEAMLYRDTFEDEAIHLRKSFAMLEEACKELRSSRLFLKLLEAVLKTGNRMNIGTIRGGARAFKLDALLKLADIKGTDGKTTLLHFVVQEMIRSEGIRESEIITKKNHLKTKNMTVEEREEDYRRLGLDLVSGLSTELCNVKKTATVDLDVFASSVSNLSNEMLRLQHLVHDDLSMDQNCQFVHSMQSFLGYAEKSIKELQKDENRVLQHVKEITEYFHGHVSKDEANPLRIFVIVRDFLGMLDQVCKEVRTLKITHIPNSIAPFR